MRTIDRIVIHCSATEQFDTAWDVERIRKYHKAPPPEGRGFRDIGYHFVVYIDGSVHPGRPIEQSGAHAQGFNDHSVGICYIGGLIKGHPADTRTHLQKIALRNLVTTLRFVFPGIQHVNGHRDLSVDMNGDGVITPNEWMKSCPCFDVYSEL